MTNVLETVKCKIESRIHHRISKMKMISHQRFVFRFRINMHVMGVMT